MEIILKPGSYVVAVSGGVDSMSLLHSCKDKPGVELVVAHFDHGIRPDSGLDRKLVEQMATRYGLPFVYKEGKLDAGTSEAAARTARYTFLKQVQKDYQAEAILTAHHQDDVLETVILNLLRGTGRKGLSSLRSDKEIIRPLLGVRKQQIINYAHQHNLSWREDTTNHETTYLRNYVRHQLLANLAAEPRRQLLGLIERMSIVNDEIDQLLQDELSTQSENAILARRHFQSLTHSHAKELLATWLRNSGLRELDRQLLERATVAAKVARPGKKFELKQGYTIEVKADNLALTVVER